ncbi:MAG: cytochrome c [Rhodobacteraceae bacterium]|nr:cytochrome c [Paracoccaceae bacterium]
MTTFSKGSAAFAAGLFLAATTAFASGITEKEHDYDIDDEAEYYHNGAPAVPSEAWLLAAGGRIYDNWWEALDKSAPEYFTHPSYPETGTQTGAATWRCVECHGWDYKGAEGVYRAGSHYTGIMGIDRAFGKPVGEIFALLRGPVHAYNREMIADEELARVAAFVSRGQFDMTKYVDPSTRQIIAGDADRGRNIFQTICAACHGFDGRRLNWGGPGENAFIGTEATTVPDEVLNKILHSHTGVDMANLQAFGPEVAIDVLRYVSTLPVE